MSLTKTVGFFAGTTLAISGVAFGAEQNNDALSQIAELKAEIASLRTAQQGDQWLTEQRATEIRGIVTDVLADSETRSSLQGSGAGAGYNGGFFLASADGNYSMKINVLQQIRWTFNDRTGASENGLGNNNNWGFENKRSRLSFGGNMVDSTWTYKLSYYFAYSNDVEFNGESPVLADAYVAKDLGDGLTLTVGQFKLPFSGEYGVDAGNLQFNDYSTISNTFTANYGAGVMIGYASDGFRINAAYVNAISYLAAGSDIDNGFDANSPAAEYAFTARAEIKASGTWEQFNDAQSFKGDEFGVLVGFGANWENANSTNSFTNDDAQIFGATADVTMDFGGASVMGAFYWDNVDSDAGTFNPFGFTVQGGVFVSDDVEIVARYEYGDLDGFFGNDFSALTLGANWYVAKNQAKLGVNFGYAFDSVTGLWAVAADGNNLLEDDAGEDGQWLIQAQLSFSF
jgi:hypothetical protein